MIGWIFTGITLTAVISATFFSDLRRAILALWVAGLGVGGIYLSLGAELLAIVQWIISTLVAVSFIFFAVMFGEFGAPNARPLGKAVLSIALSASLGLAFPLMIWIGSASLGGGAAAAPVEGNDLLAIGKALTERHLISLEVLALTLFLVLIGGGVVARPEGREEEERPT